MPLAVADYSVFKVYVQKLSIQEQGKSFHTFEGENFMKEVPSKGKHHVYIGFFV